MAKVFLVVDTYPHGDRDPACDIISAGLSVSAVIKNMIEMGYIRGVCLITPDSSRRKYFLDEYLKDWKEELPLLTQNKFNDWFGYEEYKIIDFPLVDEKN